MSPRRSLTPVVALLLAAACGGTSSVGSDGGRPTIVVTTSILGDVVGELVGDRAEVVTIMPPGADPHTFQPSAQQAAAMAAADAIVVNGAGFEAGLRSVVDNAAAEGVAVHEAIEAVDALHLSDDHAHVGGDPHGDEEPHGDADPHFFTDPVRMAQAVRGIAAHLEDTVPSLGQPGLAVAADELVAELEAIDAEITRILDAVPGPRRILVTDHEVFGYFADRYDFRVVGVVVPGGTTAGGVSGGALAALADTISDAGVPAIFTSSADASALADTLAGEVGDVEVVALFAESLGPEGSAGDTYRGMMLTNARRIADALAP